MKKSIGLLLAGILLIAAMMLAGCQKNPEDVKLISSEESIKYVSKNLPAAKYKSREAVSDDKVNYHFEDELCGFEFTVTSEKVKAYFDATVVGYKEQTSDNWVTAYSAYLKEKLSPEAAKLAAENGFSCEWQKSTDESSFLSLRTEKTAEELTPVLRQLGALIKAEDKHGKLAKGEIWCFSGSDTLNYNNVHTVYLCEKDEVTDKQGREAYRDASKKTAESREP